MTAQSDRSQTENTSFSIIRYPRMDRSPYAAVHDSRQHVSARARRRRRPCQPGRGDGHRPLRLHADLPAHAGALDVTLNQGAWLATANYVGYLVGACLAFVLTPSAGVSARVGPRLPSLSPRWRWASPVPCIWLLLRLVAGVASAFVLVGASAWALAHLASQGRSDLAGWVFAGVGIGICLAGLVALALDIRWRARACLDGAGRRRSCWWPLQLGRPCPPHTGLERSAVQRRWAARSLCLAPGRMLWLLRLRLHHPGDVHSRTARALVDDPLVFGWAWPVFGLAAAVSTVGVTKLFRSHRAPKNRRPEPPGHGGRSRGPDLGHEPSHACDLGSLRRRHLHGDDDGGPSKRPGASQPDRRRGSSLL